MADLQPIFEQLKGILASYASRLEVRYDTPERYELWSDKEIEIPTGPHGYGKAKGPDTPTRTRKGVMFAAVIIQKRWVGFYFIPIYSDPEIEERLDPELLALLTGKSCFRVRELSEATGDSIAAALRIGWDVWSEKGWV